MVIAHCARWTGHLRGRYTEDAKDCADCERWCEPAAAASQIGALAYLLWLQSCCCRPLGLAQQRCLWSCPPAGQRSSGPLHTQHRPGKATSSSVAAPSMPKLQSAGRTDARAAAGFGPHPQVTHSTRHGPLASGRRRALGRRQWPQTCGCLPLQLARVSWHCCRCPAAPTRRCPASTGQDKKHRNNLAGAVGSSVLVTCTAAAL